MGKLMNFKGHGLGLLIHSLRILRAKIAETALFHDTLT
jgi:hypothetical protein